MNKRLPLVNGNQGYIQPIKVSLEEFALTLTLSLRLARAIGQC